MQRAAAPYALYFCVGALVAAVLLSWYYDQSRLFCSASAIILTVLALGPMAIDSGMREARRHDSAAPHPHRLCRLERARRDVGRWPSQGRDRRRAGCRRLLDRQGEWRRRNRGSRLSGGLDAGAGLPWLARLMFAIGAITLLTVVFRRRTKVEQGVLWALVAMFLGLNELDGGLSAAASDALFFYSGTAGLVLVLAVLEHGYDIAYRDELTGLPGRRAFNNVMEQLGGTYAIAMCDVDHFKRFNDTYGHDVGDQVLRMVASRLSHVGGGGRTFRYGGEEFLVVFRGRSAREAEPFVESLRRSVADGGFFLRSPDRPARKPRRSSEAKQTKGPRVDITISIGLAERSQRHSTPELVLDAADAALYRAKEAGRNCVKLDESTPAVQTR